MSDISEDLAQFARRLRSLWAIQVLHLLYQDRARVWMVSDICRDLRSTDRLIVDTTALLSQCGVIACEGDGSVRYQPATPEIDDLVERLIQVYRLRPLALTNEIYSLPNERLRVFSDAFKLKKD